jgi:hypothetical protein
LKEEKRKEVQIVDRRTWKSEKRKKRKHSERERERGREKREREPERRQQGTNYKARGERFIMDDSAGYVDRIRAVENEGNSDEKILTTTDRQCRGSNLTNLLD